MYGPNVGEWVINPSISDPYRTFVLRLALLILWRRQRIILFTSAFILFLQYYVEDVETWKYYRPDSNRHRKTLAINSVCIFSNTNVDNVYLIRATASINSVHHLTRKEWVYAPTLPYNKRCFAFFEASWLGVLCIVMQWVGSVVRVKTIRFAIISRGRFFSNL